MKTLLCILLILLAIAVAVFLGVTYLFFREQIIWPKKKTGEANGPFDSLFGIVIVFGMILWSCVLTFCGWVANLFRKEK